MQFFENVSSVVNLVLDIVFISFFHMGVEGAAWATVISQIISMALCLIQLLRTEDSYKITVKELKVDPRILKQIVSMGLPSGVQNSIIGFANVVVQSNVNAPCTASSRGRSILPVYRCGSGNQRESRSSGNSRGYCEYAQCRG